MTHLSALRAAMLLTLAASPALAGPPGSLIASSAASATTAYSGTAAQALKLNDAGATTITFKTTKANETVLLNFTITCNVTAGLSATGTEFLTQYDGKNVMPSGPTFGCAAAAGTTGPYLTTSWSSFVTVPAIGTHAAAVVLGGFPAGSSMSAVGVAAVVSH